MGLLDRIFKRKALPAIEVDPHVQRSRLAVTEDTPQACFEAVWEDVINNSSDMNYVSTLFGWPLEGQSLDITPDYEETQAIGDEPAVWPVLKQRALQQLFRNREMSDYPAPGYRLISVRITRKWMGRIMPERYQQGLSVSFGWKKVS